MAAVDLSQAYALLHELAVRRGKYAAGQLAELMASIETASPTLSEQEAQFSQWLDRARDASASDDDGRLVESLLHLRIAAMDIATDFSNFVDDLSFLFQRESVRANTASGISGCEDA